jgi:hypothetical protein
LLPLIALWANLHEGFIFGLALLAPIDAEAISFERLNAAGSTITARQVRAEKFLTKLRK